MPREPSIVRCDEQPYLAIRRLVTMQTIAEIADRVPEVLGWLATHGVTPAGAPFLECNLIESDRSIRSDVLPAGRYATVTHVGHPRELMEVTTALLAWAAEPGLRWDMSESSKWETELLFRLAD